MTYRISYDEGLAVLAGARGREGANGPNFRTEHEALQQARQLPTVLAAALIRRRLELWRSFPPQAPRTLESLPAVPRDTESVRLRDLKEFCTGSSLHHACINVLLQGVSGHPIGARLRSGGALRGVLQILQDHTA
jgi:hypothetical protein